MRLASALTALAAGCVLFGSVVLSAADEPGLPPEGQAVLDKYIASGAKLQADAQAKRQAARAKLGNALDALQAGEAKAGHLDAALAVKKLHDGLQADPASDPAKVPPDAQWPKGVGRAVEAYQADSAKLEKELAPKVVTVREQAIKDLEAVKVAQTKAGKLDVALLIKQTQEQLRSGQPAAAGSSKVPMPARYFAFAAGIGLEPADSGALRHGGSALTLEFMVATLSKDGLLFKCGGGGNGHSVALVGDEVWYAIAYPRGHGILVKAPLNGAKPPLHLAVTFKDGEVAIWVNGVLGKKEVSAETEIGDNGFAGGWGDIGNGALANHPAMPHQTFEGGLAAFRLVDKVVYAAPFTPAYPFPATTAVRLAFDAKSLEPGAVKEVSAGGPMLRPIGELKVVGR